MAGRFGLIQGISLGASASLSSVNLASLPIGASLGQTWQDSGKTYKLVQVVTGGVATVAGGAAIYTDKTNNIVTMKASTAETANSIAGGFLTAAVTTSYYTVIQVGGTQTGVSVAAATAAGDQLSQSATDGQLAKTAAATACVNIPVAVALTAVSGGTSTVDWKTGNL